MAYFVKDRNNTRIFGLEPYSTNDYILKKRHLVDIWCSLVGVKYDGERNPFGYRLNCLLHEYLGNLESENESVH